MQKNYQIRYAAGCKIDNILEFSIKWQNFLKKRISGYDFREQFWSEDIVYYEPINEHSGYWNQNGFLRTVRRTGVTTLNSYIFVDYKENSQTEERRYKLNVMPTPVDLARNFNVKKRLEPLMKISGKNCHLYFTNLEHNIIFGGGPYFELVIQNAVIQDEKPREMSMVTLIDRTKDKYSDVVDEKFQEKINKVFELFREFMGHSIMPECGPHQTHYDIYSCYSSCLDGFLPF